MAKTLRDKLKPILVADGVFYPSPMDKEAQPIIILEEVNKEAEFSDSYLNDKGRVLGFRAYHKLTEESYSSDALISKGIGNPKIYLIVDSGIPVDYAENLRVAKVKAHEYLFNKIVDEELLHCSDAYTNLLDTTEIGIDRFKKVKKSKKNKANLSAKGLEALM